MLNKNFCSLSVDDLDKGILYVKLNGPIGLTMSSATPVEDRILEIGRAHV